MKKSFSIIISVVICLLVGWVSGLMNSASIETWYPMLEKSSFTPPSYVFPIVWSVLYVLMGISAGLLYNVHNISKRPLLILFAVQLLFNVSWNFFFFSMQSPILGFVSLLILIALGVAYFVGTLWIKRSSAFFFLPYLIWILFATYLNFYIVVYN
ncbi:MAG: tryptophan-rich sensory protein [Bacteroidaceae bacterium]|nr:tryptophan-rich sensory protein [Bacteroidaceae bacterium]